LTGEADTRPAPASADAPTLARLASSPLVALLAALAAGAAHAFSFAPFNRPALQLAALAALTLLALRQPSWQRAAACGFAFGLGWFGVGVSWVYISMHTYGEMPAWISGLATGGLVALLAVFPALAAGAAHRASERQVARLLLAWPGAWCLSEWLRGTVLTGLPWIASGYAHTDGPLAGFAPVLGVYGLCLVAALIAGAVAVLLQRPSDMTPAIRVCSLAAALLLIGGGQLLRAVEWTHPTGTPLRVKLVQGNIPQDLKFGEGGTELAVQRYFALMPDPPELHTDLTVLPESAFPVPLDDLPVAVHDRLLDFPSQQHEALIFGIFLEQPRYQYYNSAVGLQGHEPLQRYSKRHLVPFGEYIPFGFRWFVDLMKMPIGDQQHGPSYQPPMQLAGQRIAVNICFEDLFGGEIIQAWRDPALQPTMLLNLSNLAWFNDSIALPQHLQISQMRALETGRPLLRATNTGATAIIDPHGHVQDRLPFNLIATLHGEVSGFEGRTPYVRCGDLPALGLAVIALVTAAAARIAGRRALA
jgi:apolipoprotein N-acyltransferase